MGAGPDPAPTLSLDPPLYVLRLWGLASYNPQTLFAAKGLLSGNSLDPKGTWEWPYHTQNVRLNTKVCRLCQFRQPFYVV